MIGIDIIEISRINNLINKNPRFLEKVFTEKEIKYFETKNFKAQTIAGNFSAKEAISKAFQTGVRNFEFKDIEVLRDELGSPVVNVYNNLEKLKNQKKVKEIFVSISHSKEYAVANALLVFE